MAEFERACEEHGVTREQVRAFLAGDPRFGGPLHKAPHAYAGTAADLVAEVAPYITKSRLQRWRQRLTALAKTSSRDRAQVARTWSSRSCKSAVEAAPDVAARVKEDVATYREARKAEKAKKAAQPSMEAAAE